MRSAIREGNQLPFVILDTMAQTTLKSVNPQSQNAASHPPHAVSTIVCPTPTCASVLMCDPGTKSVHVSLLLLLSPLPFLPHQRRVGPFRASCWSPKSFPSKSSLFITTIPLRSPPSFASFLPPCAPSVHRAPTGHQLQRRPDRARSMTATRLRFIAT